jgi:hypothetical protein
MARRALRCLAALALACSAAARKSGGSKAAVPVVRADDLVDVSVPAAPALAPLPAAMLLAATQLSAQLVVSGLPNPYTAETAATVQDAIGAAAQSLLPPGAAVSASVSTFANAVSGAVVLQGASPLRRRFGGFTSAAHCRLRRCDPPRRSSAACSLRHSSAQA